MKVWYFLFVSAILCLLVAASARTAPIEGLVLYLPFDEGAGDTVSDLSGEGNHGILMGNPQWVDGKTGTGLQFNGEENSNYVEIPDDPSLNPKMEITCAAWIYSDSYQRTAGIISKYIGAGNQRAYDLHMFHDLDRSINATFSSDGTYQAGISATILNTEAETVVDGQWAFVTMTFKAGDFLRLYIDGEMKAETDAEATESIFDNEVTLLIGTDFEIGGAHNGQAREFTGIIDEVTIFSRVISDEEILQVMDGNVMAVKSEGKLAVTWGKIKE